MSLCLPCIIMATKHNTFKAKTIQFNLVSIHCLQIYLKQTMDSTTLQALNQHNHGICHGGCVKMGVEWLDNSKLLCSFLDSGGHTCL